MENTKIKKTEVDGESRDQTVQKQRSSSVLSDH